METKIYGRIEFKDSKDFHNAKAKMEEFKALGIDKTYNIDYYVCDSVNQFIYMVNQNVLNPISLAKYFQSNDMEIIQANGRTMHGTQTTIYKGQVINVNEFTSDLFNKMKVSTDKRGDLIYNNQRYGNLTNLIDQLSKDLDYK